MAFGDIIGSVVANNTLVLGTVALLSNTPLQPNMFLFLISSFFMVVVAFLFTTFVEVEKHILWQEGVALIMLYVLFVIVVLNIRMLEISYGIQ
jgi:cation:H+ antiporter